MGNDRLPKKIDQKYLIIGIVIILLVVIILAAALWGGGNASQDLKDPDQNPTNPDLDPTGPDGEYIGYTALYNYNLYTIDSFDSRSETYSPWEGHEYVIAAVILKNNDSEDIYSDSSYWVLNIDGEPLGVCGNSDNHPSSDEEWRTLAKGEECSFSLVYEVPLGTDLSNAELKYVFYPSNYVVDENYTVPEMYLGSNPVPL